ncbi:uncharacterized protein LY89DRAFT_678374 [Mollisia scopiformis]|uniref:Uncharacterized protein n=1 Tax=Mollisia scopiformis TaxID=149040 RepID=A0A132B3G4_MOLSC|nr:uncharacterized protein LY89DRAFT_678374 [Mollisia scopiformis]KUJ06793.1 hypothetical protein LY89DRAFT_678374 [Mollisia scopiformis]
MADVKSKKYKETVIELDVAGPKVEDVEAGRSKALALATLHEEPNSRNTTPFYVAQHPTLQSPTSPLSRANWYEVYREPGKDPKPPDPSDVSILGFYPLDISSYIRNGRFTSFPELFESHYVHAVIPSGGVALGPLESLPVEPSRRNAELFHFFIQRLSPFMCSIDGHDPPATFMDQWLPFMTQSPISIYITLLTASYFQAATHRIKVENSVDAMAAKGRLISLINAHIVTHSKGVNDESIAAVMSLAYNEV